MLNQKIEFRDISSWMGPDLLVSEDISQLSVTIADHPEQFIEQWKYLEKFSNDPFSNYAWVKAWYDAHQDSSNGTPVIILGTNYNNRPLFLLPLIRQRHGPFNILLRPGRKHSAYSGGLFSPECRQMIESHNADKFWHTVFSKIPKADVLAIDGLHQREIVQHNPLRFLPLMVSSSPSSETLLSPDWEVFYNSKLNGKARRNIRRCEKRLSEHGELRFVTGKSKEDRLALLQILLEQKAEQFRQRGIVNPYKMKSVSAFYENLIEEEENSDTPSLNITAMVLDDQPLAVNFGLIQGREFHGLIMSMAPGAHERFSPGRILLIRTMQHLTEIGISNFDFGVGQATYKDEWVDNNIDRYHVLAPLSLKGKLLAFGIRRTAALKSFVKRSGKVEKITRRALWHSMKD